MTYATQQNMIDRFEEKELIDLTDRTNLGVINTVVLGQALADADAKIDGYLSSRYVLPLNPIPTSLVRIACDLARYFMYDNHATEEVRNRYKDAEKFLISLGKGEITLGPDPSGTQVSGSPEVSAPPRIFTNTTLQDF